MAQLTDITFDENGKILFVHNRICLKSDCKSSKLYQKTILLMSPEEQHNLKKQILVPSLLFSQFETKSTGEKLIADEYSNKVALCFQHLTRKTQNYYLKHKALPDWAELKQHSKKVGKVYLPDPKRGQNYYWSGHRYSKQALYRINLFQLPETKTVETKDVASLDVHMVIETEHIVQAISDTSDIDDVQFEVPVPSTSVRLHKTWHEDQLRSETDISSDESDADVLVQAKKPTFTEKDVSQLPSTSVRLHKTWHEDQLRSETDNSTDESDAVVMVQAKKCRYTKKDELAVVPSVITLSEITQIPRNEDSAHYLKVQKLLVSQLQVEEVKNQKLTEELELSRLQTVKLLAENEQMKIQFAAKESCSVSLRESPSLLHRAQPLALKPGKIIIIHSYFGIIM